MLKSLEVFGFKSFADRTVFEFAPGVTCVVGPNGSGKSNVVDSIKWILGDQSAKSLRGKEMSDVIFNGSNGRKPSGFAEATLTFDNTQKLFPVESIEVQIGRRLYRSGESEYLLNRAPVRLKDVRDLFMGTGAGTAAYSIIEQGRVDQILQSNPAARRVVFEEAAGISKYKSRKVEAERRLERVAQNLARLTDIVDEVETQLNATRSQASKAARFRELSIELQQAWTGLAADEFRHRTKLLGRVEAELLSLGAELETLLAEIQRIESVRRETEERLSVIDDGYMAQQRRGAACREAIAALESTIRHQTQRHHDLDQDISRKRRQLCIAQNRARHAQREVAAIREKLEVFAGEVANSRQAMTERQAQLEELQCETDARRTRLQQRRKEVEALQNQRGQHVEQATGLKSQLNALQQAGDGLQERLQKTEAELQQAGAELHRSQQDFSQAQASLHAAEEFMHGLQGRRGELAGQASEARRRLQELRERRSAAGARLAVLEEQELQQDGIAIGVREILRRAEASRFPPWNSVLGIVRDLLEAPLEYAPVIDAALGERAQLIAVTRLDPWFDYLARGPAPIDGRVGFVSICALETSRQQILADVTADDCVDFTGQPGVIGRADRLLEESSRAAGLGERVLADTWIVESMSVARELAAISAGRCRFVTLQGEVLDQSEKLFLGTVPHESSLVSRRSELRRLKSEIHQLDRGIESFDERQQLLSTTLSSHDSQVAQAQQELQRCTTLVTETSARRSSAEQTLQRIEREFQSLLQQVEDTNRRLGAAQNRLTQIQEQVAGLDDQLDHCREDQVGQEAELQEIVELLDSARQMIRDEQLALATHEERVRSLQETQRRLNDDQRQQSHQAAELASQLDDSLASRRKTQFQILHATGDMSEQFVRLEAILSAQEHLAAERNLLRASRAQTAQREEELHRQRRELADRRHQSELDIRETRNELRVLGERIREEYQVSLEELASGDASAYRALLLERFAPDIVDIVWSSELGSACEEQPVDLNDHARTLGDEAEYAPLPRFSEVREELDARVDRLRRKLKSLGHVNTQALESLEELETRFAGLSGQLQDLLEAKAALEDIIRRINGESRRIFLDTFETIRVHFKELFRKLFGGGDADIILENPDDVLECGIDIVARPPGKELRSLSLLSGGEKTMTAVAMLFAMFKSKPSPYCILDEVDAALDDANVERYVTVVREFVSMTQFVIITHRKRTMTAADVMYGVTMEQAGVSKRLAVRFEEVAENGEIRAKGAA